MSEWDPERESYEPERDFRRDYLTPGLGQTERTPGRRRTDYERGVWSIGGSPREAYQRGQAEVPPPEVRPEPPLAGPHSGKGPRGYRRSDTRIYEEVCDALERHGEIDASDVEVSVADGEVTLSGTVADRATRRLAEDVAAECAGVRDVHNRLRASETKPER
ncbi:MAG TPA: BON domain-containing protein [Vicinamibacteria bacterium]|nr:BON domain-containing protein [Vicinamibacteria bacterium]